MGQCSILIPYLLFYSLCSPGLFRIPVAVQLSSHHSFHQHRRSALHSLLLFGIGWPSHPSSFLMVTPNICTTRCSGLG
jgi:hypothetical protein